MSKFDKKISQVMREMARRRWAGKTEEERKEFGAFLATTRKSSRKVKEQLPALGDLNAKEVKALRDEYLFARVCFRCQRNEHYRCLGECSCARAECARPAFTSGS